MATINDFKIVNQYSKKYFDFINYNGDIRDIDRKRFGFYLLVLECITGNANTDEVIDSIIDTEFCSVIYGINNNDYGIDAVYVDEERRIIQLFNFKFRESFNLQKGQNERNVLDSSKFLMKIQNETFKKDESITNKKLKLINEKFESDEIWSTELYLISNDNIGLKSDNETISDFTDMYDIKINSVTLDDIISFISDRPNDISSKFIVNAESVLIYEENTVSSSKSYLVKLSIANLIRMTCKNVKYRNNPTLQELDELEDAELELGILYDNVRGYLGETRFNKNILNTLDKEASKFFMYNNGITITAKDIIMKPINGNKKFECTINGLQVVNGGQTVRTIYEFKKRKFDEEKLATAEVLVRLFKTEDDQELTNNIAEYTNSQNAISSVDLKSISNLQIQIEKYLKTEDILYIRKAGNIDYDEKKYKYRMTMERLAQIIYSHQGYPDRATNQKSQLFERYYDAIFDEENLDLELLVYLISFYKDIEMEYEKSDYDSYVQKYFYVIFLKSKLVNKTIGQLIKLVEDTLIIYRKDENLSDARKLIQKGFRLILEEKIKEIVAREG